MTKAQALLEEMKNLKKLPPNVRKKINAELHPMGTTYHAEIPLGDIQKILEKYGLIMLQEDRTKWSGFLLGRNSQGFFDLGYKETADEDARYTRIDNTTLNLSWYKMPSGKYEIIAYLG